MNPCQWGCATPHLPLQEANVSEPLTGPRYVKHRQTPLLQSLSPHPQLQEVGVPATRTPLLMAFALAAGLSILPAPARSDAGKTLRLMPHCRFVDRRPAFLDVAADFTYDQGVAPEGVREDRGLLARFCRQDVAARGKKGPAPRQGTRVLPEAASSRTTWICAGLHPERTGRGRSLLIVELRDGPRARTLRRNPRVGQRLRLRGRLTS
jgi:hypothetical protein